MTKSKKRSSRFFSEQDSLFETSDMQPQTKKKSTLRESALTAEDKSKRTATKIVKKNAPVEEVIKQDKDDDKIATSRDDRLET